MRNEHTNVHPELIRIAKRIPRLQITKNTLWLYDLMISLMPAPPIARDVRVDDVFVQCEEDQHRLRLRIYRPRSMTEPTPVLVWLHGGGYVIGKPEISELVCAQYARELHISVVSVDYRRAPKHPFPAGLQDGYAAAKWVTSHAQRLGFDAEHVAIGGESAGGGLAAALAQLAHDRQEIRPVFQLLVYPMLDDRTALRSDLDAHPTPVWPQQSNRFGWQSYLGTAFGQEDLPAYAVPARRLDLSGLPPAWIGVGTLDLFYAEDSTYAQRLKEADVACECLVVPGAFHAFDVFAAQTAVARRFRESQLAALRRHLFT